MFPILVFGRNIGQEPIQSSTPQFGVALILEPLNGVADYMPLGESQSCLTNGEVKIAAPEIVATIDLISRHDGTIASIGCETSDQIN